MSDIQIVAAITLYNPKEKVYEYILELRKIFPHIYLFDNTENEDILKKSKKNLKQEGITYFSKGVNMGLAYGLNVCCNRACKDHYPWIMLFDQDSVITYDLICKMKDFIQKYDNEKLAIVTPMIEDFKRRCVRDDKAKPKKTVITSGMILKLEAFVENGKFLNALFVDAVDIEYSLRIARKGYYILENRQAILHHNQYDKENVYDGYKVNKYSALRHYYIARGYCYIVHEYAYERAYIEQFKLENYRRFRGMITYDQHRMKKLFAIILGFIDYKRGKFGKCEWKIIAK